MSYVTKNPRFNSLTLGGAKDASALIDLHSTTGGLGLPAMNTTQRDAIVSPRDGLVIYNTTTQKVEFYSTGSALWNQIEGLSITPGAANQVLVMDGTGTTYSFAKIVNANIDATAAIDATKIHDGSVDNTEFSYLSGVTSSIQTQLNAKLDDVTVATDNALVRFDTNGQALQNSTVIVDDSGNMSGVANITTSGNIDKASAASLDIGGTNATTINVGRSGQTTVIKGNLQVDGTTTTVNSTTMEVADANIVVNNGGNNASAEGAGLQVEGTSGSNLATLQYAAALASKFKIGASGSESEIITASTAQTMTGVKTFDEELVLKHNATPSTPSSGYVKTYVKSDNKAYILDSSGNEVPLGSSTGAGEVNINTNPNADSGFDLNGSNDVGDWIDSGTGTTVSKTTTSSEIPLYPIRTSGIKIVNDGSGTGYTRLRMTLPESLKNNTLKVQWEQLYSTGTAYVSGDFKVEVYSNASSDYSGAYTEIALTTDSSGTSAIPALNGRYVTKFETTTATYLELRIVRTAGSANSFISLNDVIIGPGIQPQGAVVGEWTSYTPTGSWVSNTTYSGRYRRVGSQMEVQAYILLSGAPTSTALTVNLPSGFTIDTSNSLLNYTSAILGQATIRDNGIAPYQGTIGYNSTTSVNVKATWAASNYADNATAVTQSVPFTFANSDEIYLSFTVPIAEWAGSGTVNLAQNDVEYASTSGTWDAASSTTVYGPTGVAMGGALTANRTKTVTFQSPIQAGDKIEIETSSDGIVWLPIIGSTAGNAGGVVSNSHNAAGTWQAGCAWEKATATSIYVYFAQYANMANDDAPATNWGTYYWRVKKTAAGAAVGWGRATETVSGLAPQGVFKSGLSNTIALQPLTVTPQNPNTSSDGHIYIKGSKLIIQFNDAGTIRYKYLDLTSTGVTWVHTLTPP